MRVTAELWVKAYIRRCMAENVPALVVRRGQSDAGAIFLKVNRLDGRVCLWGPAPAGLAEVETDRQWSLCHEIESTSEAEADAYLERQLSFDPDIWIVEVEDHNGRNFLEPHNLA